MLTRKSPRFPQTLFSSICHHSDCIISVCQETPLFVLVPLVTELNSGKYGGTAGMFWSLSTGGTTSTPRNSCSFGRKIIIKTGICSLRPGEFKNTCFLEILDCCGIITRKSCDPCKEQGPKHTSCTSVGNGYLNEGIHFCEWTTA